MSQRHLPDSVERVANNTKISSGSRRVRTLRRAYLTAKGSWSGAFGATPQKFCFFNALLPYH